MDLSDALEVMAGEAGRMPGMALSQQFKYRGRVFQYGAGIGADGVMRQQVVTFCAAAPGGFCCNFGPESGVYTREQAAEYIIQRFFPCTAERGSEG